MSLIPFAKHIDTGEFVDVYDVPNGGECGCVCPSCGTPLIARQGAQKAWHFAHASRGVFEEVEKECEISYEVSVRLMARQIINDGFELKLPRYEDYVSVDVTRRITKYQDFEITSERVIQLSDVQTEAYVEDSHVDVLAEFKDYLLILYFTHKGRDVPSQLFDPDNRHCGVLSISLGRFSAGLQQGNFRAESYKQRLEYFLCEDLEHKQWIFHPRYDQARQQAQDKLNADVIEFRKRLESQPNSKPARQRKLYDKPRYSDVEQRSKPAVQSIQEVEPVVASFECLSCGVKWTGLHTSTCPNGHEHLYKRELP